jgi:hypothetical protein
MCPAASGKIRPSAEWEAVSPKCHFDPSAGGRIVTVPGGPSYRGGMCACIAATITLVALEA